MLIILNVISYRQLYNNMRYSNLQEEEDTVAAKIRRSVYLIISISLLTHTFSLVYSLITYQVASAGFISIIVSALSCFFISSSHLTIYGISVLGTLYLSMIRQYYSTHQLFYTVALSGIIMFAFWKPLHSLGSIFHCLPGRIHASLVFGIVLIVLSRFFPLAIENIEAFFSMSSEKAMDSPFGVLNLLFLNFNVVTLIITIVLLVLMILLRKKLQKIPLIGIMVILGILLNYNHQFKSYSDICALQQVNYKQNLKQPLLTEIVQIIPTAIIMTIVVTFEQFLYLEEFERRGKRYLSQGSLGEVTTETKVLAVANIISGCLGGLPICINIFGTYQNFAFNKTYGFKGTKWVGVLVIPFSFLLYTLASFLFMMIPMFVLFIIVATPVIYFVRNVFASNYQNLHTILIIALISVFTHPIIALIFACFVSIYEISQLLKPAPAELLVECGEGSQADSSLNRKSTLRQLVAEKQQEDGAKIINEFTNRIVEIDTDIPEEYQGQQYVIYRFIGSISYMNFYQHLKELTKVIDTYCPKGDAMLLIISLRYSQIIDMESLNEIANLVEQLRSQQIKVIFTGLHDKISKQMQQIPFFSRMLQEEKSIYSINIR